MPDPKEEKSYEGFTATYIYFQKVLRLRQKAVLVFVK